VPDVGVEKTSAVSGASDFRSLQANADGDASIEAFYSFHNKANQRFQSTKGQYLRVALEQSRFEKGGFRRANE
jgi:hypothetical protein